MGDVMLAEVSLTLPEDLTLLKKLPYGWILGKRNDFPPQEKGKVTLVARSLLKEDERFLHQAHRILERISEDTSPAGLFHARLLEAEREVPIEWKESFDYLLCAGNLLRDGEEHNWIPCLRIGSSKQTVIFRGTWDIFDRRCGILSITAHQPI